MNEEQPKPRGQSFMELAIFLPILLLMLSGMVEITFLFNNYLQMLDAVRYGARSVTDSNPYPQDFPTSSPGVLNTALRSPYDSITICTGGSSTLNFFRVAACNTNEQGLKPGNIILDDDVSARNNCNFPNTDTANGNSYRDDIVVSIFATNVVSGTVELKRYNSNTVTSGEGLLVEDSADTGWSYLNQMCSQITKASLQTKLNVIAPNTGFVLVETFFNSPQIMNAPGFANLFPRTIPLHAYAIFPLVAAEPTPTPKTPGP